MVYVYIVSFPDPLSMGSGNETNVYTENGLRVTIFSTGTKFRPVWIELHTLTLAATLMCSCYSLQYKELRWKVVKHQVSQLASGNLPGNIISYHLPHSNMFLLLAQATNICSPPSLNSDHQTILFFFIQLRPSNYSFFFYSTQTIKELIYL